MQRFTPKKPVRTFRDLEVYQKTLANSVIIVKNIRPKLVRFKYYLTDEFSRGVLSIPLYIGEAHSIRFADFKAGILGLEKAMAGCNKIVVYLEQIKGLYGKKLDTELLDDLVKSYSDVRQKIFRLEKSWKRYREEDLEK